MNKLIKLPNGPYIRANQIVQIGEPFQDQETQKWNYSIAYNCALNDTIRFHTATLSVIINNVDSVRERIERFVNKINEN